ncbi:hypothetical protein OAU65_01000 [Gammaproteobacteria bacterium]|nr:hypothetical protein [Gammaproteobacteria bacterium]
MMKFNKNLLVCTTLIAVAHFTLYFFLIYLSEIPFQEASFFLSLGYPSDPLYIPFINKIENLLFYESTVFPTLGVLFELLISKLIGFKFIWVMVPVLKTLAVTSLLIIFTKNKDLPIIEFLLITAFLFIIFNTNMYLFGDRFARPHIIPTIAILAFYIINFGLESKKSFPLFFGGILLSFIFVHDIWLFSCVMLGGLFHILISVNNLNDLFKQFFLISSGLMILILIANLKYFFAIPAHNMYIEFVGLKIIFSSSSFIQDFYVTLFTDIGFIVRFLLALLIGILCKDKKFLWVLVAGSMLAYLPFIITGHIIQAYHLIIAVKTFTLMCTLLCLHQYFLELPKGSVFKISSLFVIVLIINYQSYSSPMIDRASFIYKGYNNLFSSINDLKMKNSSCIVISNDIYARAYVLGFTDLEVLPKDGIYEGRSIDEVKREISLGLKIARESIEDNNSEILNDNFISKALHYATHNYFSVSKSFLPKSFENQDFNLDNNHLNKNSFLGWQMFIPSSLISSIKDLSQEANTHENQKNNSLLIIKNGYRYNDPSDLKVFDNCTH